MMGLVNPLVGCKHKDWHKHKDRDKANRDTLCQRQAEVRADLKAHQAKCKKTDYRGHSAGQDRGRRA